MPSHGTDSAASSPDNGPDSGAGDGGGSSSLETSPFTDWREQLRERVKEIRARKTAAARGEDRRTPPAARPAPAEASDEDAGATVEPSRRSGAGDGARQDEGEETVASRAQERPSIDLDRIPAWARMRSGLEDSEGPHEAAAPPDLEAIPEDLKDIPIPSWALPRRSEQQSEADPVTDSERETVLSEIEESVAEDGTLPAREDDADEPRTETASEDASHDLSESLPWNDEMGLTASVDAADEDVGGEAIMPSWAARVADDRGGRDRLGDVYLVGEFRGRRGAESHADEADGDSPEESVAGSDDGSEADLPERQGEPAAAAPAALRDLFEGVRDGHLEASPGTDSGSAVVKADLELDVDDKSDSDDESMTEVLDPSAPLADRVFSALADGMVVLVLGLALGLAGSSAVGTGVMAFVQSAPVPFATAWLIFALCYGVFFIGTCGQTPGKMAMRVRVIGADSFRVGYAKATRRALLYAVAALPAGLGLLPAVNDPEHRAVHDRLSGTRVVKA